MKKRYIVLVLAWMCMMSGALAQGDAIARMDSLFKEAENCYLRDDYQQLQNDINAFADVYVKSRDVLADDQELYLAYYYKMCGAYYYGVTEGKDSAAYYAEQSYRRSLDIMDKRNSTRNSTTLHEELAQLYYKMGNYSKACTELQTAYAYYYNNVYELEIECDEPKYYQVMSQLAMCNARTGDFITAINRINESLSYFKKQKSSEYYETLRKKAKILMFQTDAEGADNYTEAIKCYRQYVDEQYTTIGQRLATMNEQQRSQYWLATHQFLYDACRLGSKAPEMIYDLTLFSKDYLLRYEQNPKEKRVEWRQVQRELSGRDCALEFVQYFGRDDQKRMGCLVLKSTGKPVFVDLFATDSLLDVHLTSEKTIGYALVSSLTLDKDTLYEYKDLASTIWTSRLMQEISSAESVFFSPDGILHQLAIEYLMPDTVKACYRLTSTRNVKKKRQTPRLASALLCGGMTYNQALTPDAKDNDVEAYRYLAANTGTIKQLPGTKREVDSILVIRNNPNDTLLTADNATDENFTELLKRKYDIVHLATHGFYSGRIGIYTDIKPLLNDNSMSHSGVLFTGVSNTLSNKNFDEQLFDGVLSAAELAKQDFSNTELVVLSACQTGLGHLTADGVYGVQRGLKQAGAHAIILSLWSVSDKTTQMLMQYFYENLERQATKDIHAAFMAARKRLMTEKQTLYYFDSSTFSIKEEQILYNNPKYVNPFILIDAY